MGRDKDLFSQSFDIFQSNQQASHDAWSSPTSPFEHGARDVFDADPFSPSLPKQTLQAPTTPNKNHSDCLIVSIHEQLSMAFESSEGVTKSVIEGSIYVKHPIQVAAPFCLILRDPQDHIDTLAPHRNTEDISKLIIQGPGKDAGFHRTDRIFKIGLDELAANAADGDEMLIARYTCIPQLRPIPLVSDA